MNAISEFFYIGGYAWYVWGSYGVTAAFMLAEVFMVIRGKKTLMQRLVRMARLSNSNNN